MQNHIKQITNSEQIHLYLHLLLDSTILQKLRLISQNFSLLCSQFDSEQHSSYCGKVFLLLHGHAATRSHCRTDPEQCKFCIFGLEIAALIVCLNLLFIDKDMQYYQNQKHKVNPRKAQKILNHYKFILERVMCS